MPHVYGFSVRSSGRDLTQVRRPRRMAAGRPVVVAPVEPVTAESAVLEPEELNKADLANLAAAVGVDSSGTKTEVVKRVKKQTDD